MNARDRYTVAYRVCRLVLACDGGMSDHIVSPETNAFISYYNRDACFCGWGRWRRRASFLHDRLDKYPQIDVVCDY